MNGLEKQLRAAPNRHVRQQLLLKAGTKLLRAAAQKTRRQPQPKREEPAPRPGRWQPLDRLRDLIKQKEAPTEKLGQGSMTPDVNKVLRER
jgi:hypothetical protein